MAEVSMRELRNHGGDVVERVIRGESVTITRDGKPVAELHPLPRPAVAAESLLRRWHRLPAVDPRRLRRDIDSIVDPHL